MTWPNVADLGDRIGRSLSGDDRAAAVLADAIAAVQSYTGQQIAEGTSTVVVPVNRGMVRLTQIPVQSVDDVQTLGGAPIGFDFDGIRTITLNLDGAIRRFDLEPFRRTPRTIKVTYTHGFDPIPDDILAVVFQVAGRAYGVNPTDTGINQETLGSYNYSTGSAASSGALGFLLPERMVLDRYRMVGRSFATGR